MKIDKVFGVEGDSKNVRLSRTQTSKITELLESSLDFEIGIKKLRKKYGLPENGVPHPESSGTLEHPENMKYSYERLEEDCWKLAFNLNLPPEYWKESLAIYTIHGIFLAPSRRAVSVMYNPSDDFPHEFWFDLVISEKLSKSEFFRELEKEWPNIEGVIKSLPQLPKNKMIRSTWSKRIVQLRDIEKKKYKEIADILVKENMGTGSEDIITDDYVRILYQRWKNKAKRNKKKM